MSDYEQLEYIKYLKEFEPENYEGLESLHKQLFQKLKKKEKRKGFLCSVSGSNYENTIYNIVRNCKINNKLFNTQKEKDLGGSSSRNDIMCNYLFLEDIGIEVKKAKTPDWMQCSIKYINEKWISCNGKNQKCQDIFNKLINKLNIYDGSIPPFMLNQITHEEWLKIKKETNKWNDTYIDIPYDTIRTLYLQKGCKYIQISDGFGLYHLGKDICDFDVPIFDIEQRLRIRTKIHTRKNTKGFCNLSVTVACQPKNIKKLITSKFSLDNILKLPSKIKYII